MVVVRQMLVVSMSDSDCCFGWIMRFGCWEGVFFGGFCLGMREKTRVLVIYVDVLTGLDVLLSHYGIGVGYEVSGRFACNHANQQHR